jgi:hypothetical protein
MTKFLSIGFNNKALILKTKAPATAEALLPDQGSPR